MTNQIDEGFKLARYLVAAGLDVTAVFWALPSEEEQSWTLYIASSDLEQKDPQVVYRAVVDGLHKLDDPWVSTSDVRVIKKQDSLTRTVLDILQRHPGPMATRSRTPLLRPFEIEEVYIYPPVEGTVRPLPRVKIVGIKKLPSGTATKEVEDEIGYVEGYIGEAEFNTHFADLIKSRFGSAEKFQLTYPRIVLQEV